MLDKEEKNKSINEKIVRYISIFIAGELLEIHKNDISLENNTRIILRILNGDL
jgi:hypothetical protein